MIQVAYFSETFVPLYRAETRQCLEYNIQGVMTIQAQIPLQHSYLSIRLRHASAWSMYTGRSDNSDADSPSTFVAVYQTETRECLKCNIQGVLTIQAKIPLQQSYFSTKLRHASAWSIIYFAF